MARILLVYVNSFMDNLIPIGVSVLSASLKKAGHKVKLFDTTFYRTCDKTGDEARVESLQIKETNLEEFGIKEKTGMHSDFVQMIDNFKPDLIGMSIVETTYPIALELLKDIEGFGIKTIAGGIHATMAPEELIKKFDIVCVGEGEEAIVELADALYSDDYSKIENLWTKNERGKITPNPVRPLSNLDEIPDQDWSIYEKERFYKPMGGKVWISGPIELTRGCPYRCAFCCNAKLQDMYKQHGHYPRERNIHKFISELKDKIKKYKMNYLYLVAENSLSIKQFDEFIDLYSDIKLPFWIETRPETITKDKIQRIQEVGCVGLSIGVEHGNEEFRRKVLNRFVTNDRIIEAFKLAKETNIKVCANNIIGFPTETRELLFDTIELNRKIQPDVMMVNIFCPYRGTKLWDLSVEKGYIKREAIAGDYRGLDAGLDMPQLSRQDIINLQKTFPMYVKFSKDFWKYIKIAELNTDVFESLSKKYKEEFM